MKKWLSKKKNAIKLVVVLVLLIGLGYAFLNANLKINGISNIGNVKWEVYFENSALTEGNTLAGAAAPVIEQGTKPTEIGYNVTFNNPGEVYEFTVDIKNGGTIDATVTGLDTTLQIGEGDEVKITDKSVLPAYLDYDLTDEDGNAITLPFDLNKTGSKTIKVKVTFKQDITNDQLAEAANKSIKFTVGVVGKQKGAPDNNGGSGNGGGSNNNIKVLPLEENAVYSLYECNYDDPYNKDSVYIGDTKESITGYVEDYRDLNKQFFLRHVLDSNDKVLRNDVCFVKDDAAYCIKGRPDDEYSSDAVNPLYDDNRDLLLDVFGPNAVANNICSVLDDGYNASDMPETHTTCSFSDLTITAGYYHQRYENGITDDNLECINSFAVGNACCYFN